MNTHQPPYTSPHPQQAGLNPYGHAQPQPQPVGFDPCGRPLPAPVDFPQAAAQFPTDLPSPQKKCSRGFLKE